MSQFSSLTHLRYLDMSGNKIVTINGSSWYLPNLTTLLLARNGIVSIPESFLAEKFLPSLRVVDLQRLPFSCDCQLSWFRKWAESDKVVALEGFSDYRCSSSTDSKVSYVKDFNPWLLKCESNLVTEIIIILSCATVIMVSLSAVCVYNRWYIKYACFVVKLKVRGYREIVDLEEKQKKYDAFVSYNSKDEDFVDDELLHHLETKFRICVDSKHFIGGKSIIDNIIDSIQDSRKTILLLTPNFVKSEWCYFEMQMALHRLFDEGRDVVVLVLLEPIPEKDLPRRLRKLFAKKTFIEWPQENNQTARQLFWAKLEDAIKVPGKVDRLHKV
ncbi:toll-like receptor 1 [Ptychodera flava]|uniref:toll-like receptor 1 n=1 Tax=Ptychodera flava TaxID=63121 RepID=UPI00396A8C7D